MPCYHPLDAWQRAPGAKPVFKFRPGYAKLELPCGRCIGCRLEYARQWALRCHHEASLYDQNCFITFTYSDKYRPADGSLRPRDVTLFLKRFRKAIYPRRIRYFFCGEYGEACANCGLSRALCLRGDCKNFIATFGHPHYHMCLFGYDFMDRYKVRTRSLNQLYRSDFLDSLWVDDNDNNMGLCFIGELTFESAGYVARYVTKKINGPLAIDHYKVVDGQSGEIIDIHPEFIRMSRGTGNPDDDPRYRGGIASGWYEKYSSDLDKDFITVRGRKMRPARFYDRLLKKVDDVKFNALKDSRKLEAIKNARSPEQLAVSEQVKLRRVKLLKRGIES